MRTTLRSAGALGVIAAAAVLTLGIPTPAGAQAAEDVEQVVENLPTTAETLAGGLQATVDTATQTQSAVETSEAVIDAVVDSGNALDADTEMFAGLGWALYEVELETQRALDDYLGVIDGTHDPADLLTVDDAQTIADNREGALDRAVEDGKTATIEALQGNLLGPWWYNPLAGRSAVGNTVAIVASLETGGVVLNLTEGTNLREEGLLVPEAVNASMIAIGPVIDLGPGDMVIETEESLAPLFESAQPATAPIISLLRGL